MNVLSLFEEKSSGGIPRSDGSKAAEQVHRSPVRWVYQAPFRSLAWRERGLKLTLIGDLPKPKLLEIARSIRTASPAGG